MLIQDIKPYPSRLQALCDAYLGELVSLRGKTINVQYRRSDALTWPELCDKYWLYDQQQYDKYRVTEDDLIQEQAVR